MTTHKLLEKSYCSSLHQYIKDSVHALATWNGTWPGNTWSSLIIVQVIRCSQTQSKHNALPSITLGALRQERKWRWVKVFRYPASLGESKKCKKKESKKRLTPKAAVWKEICIRVKKIPCIDNSCDTIFCNNWIEPVRYFVTWWCAVHSQDLRGCNRALTVHLFIKSSLFQAWVNVYHHSFLHCL